MNLIINGFHDPRQSEILDGIIDLYKPEKGCIILSEDTFRPKKAGIDVFYVKDIIRGDYGCNYTGMPSEFIEYINANMCVLLDMCSRFEVYLKKDIRYEEKKRIIYRHSCFWYEYISKNDINGFIGSNIPHDIYDYIIYITMKYFKKENTLYFYQSNFLDIIIPMTDYHIQNKKIKDKYNEYLHENKTSLSPMAMAEWNLQKENVVPFYMKKGRKNIIGRIYRNMFKRAFNINNLHFYLIYNIKLLGLRREYRSLSNSPNFIKRYIYLPLHYQPELTTNPLGGIFSNQMFIIDTLLNSLPDDVFIYVKEHPKQEYICRYKGFYQDICAKSEKVVLIDKNVSSSTLIEHSLCVATVSGTAGWEALFKKKPVLLFGSNFYMYAPYVYNVRDNMDSKKALAEINDTNFSFDEDRIKIFLNAVVDTCIHGFVDALYEISSNLSFQQSNENILYYIKNANK